MASRLIMIPLPRRGFGPVHPSPIRALTHPRSCLVAFPAAWTDTRVFWSFFKSFTSLVRHQPLQGSVWNGSRYFSGLVACFNHSVVPVEAFAFGQRSIVLADTDARQESILGCSYAGVTGLESFKPDLDLTQAGNGETKEDGNGLVPLDGESNSFVSGHSAQPVIQFCSINVLLDDLQRANSAENLREILSFRAMELSTETIVAIFNKLQLKTLGVELYLWMKRQPGFELNEHVFIVAMTCFTRARQWEASEGLYEETKKHNISLSNETFYKIIREVTKARKFQLVEKWFYRMKGDLQEATTAFNGLMLAYYKQKLYDKAIAVFERMKAESVPLDLTSFCTVLSVLRDSGKAQEAMEIFSLMQKQGIPLDRKAYSIAFDTLGKAGRVWEAASLFRQMQQEGLKPDHVSYTSLIHAFAKAKMLDQADMIFKEASADGFLRDPIIFSTMIKMYADAGLAERAHEVLKMMKQVGVKTHEYAYHTVINAFVKADCLQGALNVYRDMRISGCPIHEATYTSMIKVYAKLRNEEAAERLLREMLKKGFNKNVVAYCTTIDMYSKAGNVEKALCMFTAMKRAGCRLNTWVYNILIDMFGRLGNLNDANTYFEEMEKAKLVPDSVTYSSLIMAHSKAGQFEKSIQILNKCKSAGTKLDPVLVATMINAFVKAGRYWELESLVLDAPRAGVKLDQRMYRSVLNAFLDADLHEKAAWLSKTFGSEF